MCAVKWKYDVKINKIWLEYRKQGQVVHRICTKEFMYMYVTVASKQ